MLKTFESFCIRQGHSTTPPTPMRVQKSELEIPNSEK